MQNRCLLTLAITVLYAFHVQTAAAENQAIEHIVFIWLKEPGNVQMQDRIIKDSQALKAIPGVTKLRTGKAVPSQRAVVDSSFDVALVFSFTNKAALDAYLVHPAHLELIEETMKPMVDRIRVYDLK